MKLTFGKIKVTMNGAGWQIGILQDGKWMPKPIINLTCEALRAITCEELFEFCKALDETLDETKDTRYLDRSLRWIVNNNCVNVYNVDWWEFTKAFYTKRYEAFGL